MVTEWKRGCPAIAVIRRALGDVGDKLE